MKTATTHYGTTVYQEFSFPKDISSLDKDILINTLDYLVFIAEMADDYQDTKREKAHIVQYMKEHGLSFKGR